MYAIATYIAFPLTCLIYYLYKKHYNYWKAKGVPYDPPFLIFGSFFRILLRKEHMFERIREIYNKFSTPYVGIFIFHQPVLVIRDLQIIKKILVKNFDIFPDRHVARNESIDPIAFHTFFFAQNEIWKNLRAKFSPAFTSSKIKLMFGLMNECVDDLYNHLNGHEGEIVATKLLMKKFSSDLVSSCSFGIKTNCVTNEESDIFKMAEKLLDPRSVLRGFSVLSYFFMHFFVKIFKLSFADQEAASYLSNMFQVTFKEREKKNIVRHDFMDILINLRKTEKITDSYKFDDFNMTGQALTFFLAGSEPTASALCLTFYELSLNESIQEQLREEINNSFNKTGKFTYESIKNIKYLDMVLNETFRKYPIAGFLNRKAEADFVIEETGFTVPKGTSVIIPIVGLHYDPEYFPDPNKYDPERFRDEKNIQPFSFLPFGEGPRFCIGFKFALCAIKLAIACVIKDFQIQFTDKTAVPLELDPGSIFVQNKGEVFLRFNRIR